MLAVYALSYLAEDSALGFVVSIFTGYIMVSAFLRLSRGVVVDFKNLFADLAPGKFVQYVVMMIIVTVFMVVGFLLLILPGFIVAIMTSLAAFILMDDQKDISWSGKAFWHAIKKSKHMTHGHKWKLAGFFVVVLALNILGAMAFGLGLLITVPVTCMALAYIYDRLKGPVVVPERTGNNEASAASEDTHTN